MIPLFTIPVPIPPKCAKESESQFLGIGIVPPLDLLRLVFAAATSRNGKQNSHNSAHVELGPLRILGLKVKKIM